MAGRQRVVRNLSVGWLAVRAENKVLLVCCPAPAVRLVVDPNLGHFISAAGLIQCSQSSQHKVSPCFKGTKYCYTRSVTR